ncbi:TetR family transcriptional regulator [Pandoraea fibrosis]|uniref:TetR family transcriptional regulator n=1 Tax=Pandoraea fibrosis TaxID=1891094 RepID=A0ABX6HSW2_9BURK|nr:TetR/AcrR family transcriptional regulator [Pandoraea fibrosis]QHE93091.1 TetR family transcriptional regulator [Pandoraea fibrosis]QHF13350.1 TetR family transcriptional regulator [Pandoraea fibrosis]
MKKPQQTSETEAGSKEIGNSGAAPATRRLAPEDREHQIVQSAISFFASRGFEASTRDLARELGVTQPLLYRYFPTKDALVDRVYEEVFVRRWNPDWEEWLADRSSTLAERMKRYFRDYARFILRSEWVRIFIFAGLSRPGINQKYLDRLKERHFKVMAREMRHEYKIPDPASPQEEDDEIELIWAMHSSIFYIGVRKWVYQQPAPKDLDRIIDLRVDAFLTGTPQVLLSLRA